MATLTANLDVLADDEAGLRRWRRTWRRRAGAEVFLHPTLVALFAPRDAGPTYPHAFGARIGAREGVENGAQNGGHSAHEPSMHATRIHLATLETNSGGVALAFATRPNGLGIDVTGAYPYGGAFQWGEAPPVDAFWSGYDAWCRRSGVVSEFHRLHLFDDETAPFPGTERTRSTNVVRELRSSWDAIWSDLERSVRKNVRTAASHGVRIEIDDHPGRASELWRVYTSTMLRRGAREEYLHPLSTFETLATDLPGHVAIAYALAGTRVVAAELLLLSGGRIYSFLGGSDETALAMRPNDLLKVEVMRWGQRRGATDLVLGGGLRSGDGIERFKRRFAPSGGIAFRTGERIHDPDAYAQLTSGLDAVDGHFPAYRSPVAVAR